MKPRPRPEVTEGRTYCILTGCGNFYITINNDAEGVCELFARLGKSGGCQSSQNETTGRLISIALRSGIEAQEIVDMLKGVRCPRPFVGHALSCSDAIASALNRHINGKEEIKLFLDSHVNFEICPECADLSLVREEGCCKCHSCGYSDC